jgi:hypothetical protein
MPKPNYSFEKRQRELEKKRKKAEKAQRKANPPAPGTGDGTEASQDDSSQTTTQEPPKE